MGFRILFCAALLALTGCDSRNERFENAWLGNCYIENVTHLPVGWPIPGAPGQIPSEEYAQDPLR